jgi:hypothetical protein
MVGSASAARLAITDVGPAADAATIEFRGVGAGPFDPAAWQTGSLHFVRDVRRPLIAPRDGKFRNVYAPSVVRTASGWAVFYGGWDGTAPGNDRIYRRDADAEFLSIGDGRTVIEHGAFQHVCNVNVARATTTADVGRRSGDGPAWAMMCTAYPDARGRNKPISFFGDDGERWGDGRPHAATTAELVRVDGYPRWDDADVNGMNVLTTQRDATGAARYAMYFGDFRNPGVYRATSRDGRHFAFDRKLLDQPLCVNDVRMFELRGDGRWRLMGLHVNGGHVLYTIARDGDGRSPGEAGGFPPARPLIASAGEADRFITSVGFVCDETPAGPRVLGLLYGAGEAASLDKNRIFAAWLQKRVRVEVAGRAIEPAGALGPDRQVVQWDGPAAAAAATRVELLAEDGATAIGAAHIDLKAGRAYRVEAKAERRRPSP